MCSWCVERHIGCHTPKQVFGLRIERDRDLEYSVTADNIGFGRDADHFPSECFVECFNVYVYRQPNLYIRNVTLAQIRGFDLQIIQGGVVTASNTAGVGGLTTEQIVAGKVAQVSNARMLVAASEALLEVAERDLARAVRKLAPAMTEEQLAEAAATGLEQLEAMLAEQTED